MAKTSKATKRANLTKKLAAAKPAPEKLLRDPQAARKFLFIPAAHGPGYFNVHDLACADCRRDWRDNNSSGRSTWDSADIFAGATAQAAAEACVADLVAGGHEEGAFQADRDFHFYPCCK